MKYQRILFPVVVMATLLILFVPGTVFAPRPAAAGSGPNPAPLWVGSCDMAKFIEDVTVPDGTLFSPGTAFVKTWRIENLSMCTWTTSYSLVFVRGYLMGAPVVINFPTPVPPGATVDLWANMIAPSTSGHYYGFWKLRDDTGRIFGVGRFFHTTFFVDIYVGWSAIFYPNYWGLP